MLFYSDDDLNHYYVYGVKYKTTYLELDVLQSWYFIVDTFLSTPGLMAQVVKYLNVVIR